jgi:MHS family alpha-ketoglutarate permease-like MFS transporter
MTQPAERTNGITAARLKSIIGGSAGNLVEWYDWFAYATFSIYFAPLFFPEGDLTAQLLNTAAIFAAGFLMRPIGAWIMGIYGDKHGRKAGLTLSYAQAGMAAPAILVVARMVQGLSVGGEYGSSATYLSEMAPASRRGFWSSFQYATLSGGQLLAILVALLLQATMSEAQLGDWGWRIPFVIGSILALCVYLLRRTMTETKSFATIDQTHQHSSLKMLWRDHKRSCILVAVMSGGGGLASYAFTTYMLKYLINTAGFEKQTATLIIAGVLVWSFCLQPIAGMLADRFGRKPLLFVAGVGVALVAVPVYTLVGQATSPIVAWALILIPITLHGGYTANNAMVKAELFPAHIRALGVAFPYAVGNTIFAGTLEYVALWFKSAGNESGFFWYVTACVGATVIAYWMLPETREKGLIVED